MNSATDSEDEKQQPGKDKQTRDSERTETNKTDPQLTELKGFTDPDEPLEEEGTLNPLTGNKQEGE